MQLNVIKAELSHTENIKNIAAEAWSRICPDVLTQSDIRQYLDESLNQTALSNAVNDPDSWFFMLIDDGRPVGFCHLAPKTDEPNIAFFKSILVLPDYQEHKIVYRLFQHALKIASERGITEIEIDVPECSKIWRDIFIYIGVEFEPWRKYEKTVGSVKLTFWPGLLVIVPGC